MEEPTYTFKFGIRADTMSQKDHITKREVAFSDLLDCFDAAYDWVMANPEKRYAEVHGPGMMNRVVTHTAREYILNRLPDELMKKERKYIGLAWLDLKSHRNERHYRLYKVWGAEMRMPDFPDKRVALHGFMEVDPDDWEIAFRWAQEHFWQDHGIWFRGKPGLVFCRDFEAVEEAFKSMGAMGKEKQIKELIRAPVRYAWQQRDGPYPRMAPTRSTPKIQALRHRYPTTGYDLKVTPLEILIREYGYGGQVKETA